MKRATKLNKDDPALKDVPFEVAVKTIEKAKQPEEDQELLLSRHLRFIYIER